MEPQKKKAKSTNDERNESPLSIKSDEIERPNEWDYVVDLELLKSKLTQSTEQERQRIRRLIHECLMERNNISNPEPDALYPLVQHGSADDQPAATLKLINQVIMLMSQFKRYVIQNADNKNSNSDLHNLLVQRNNSSNDLEFQPRWLGVCRSEIGIVFSSVERFFDNRFRITEREHPLCNDTVLDIVLSHLPARSWLTCRLVNHQWNSNAARIIRKNHDRIFISFPDGVGELCSTFPNTGTGQFPLSKFYFSIHSPRNDSLIFFTNYGSNLKKLTLHVDPWQDPEDPISLRRVFLHILQNIPHLDSLGFYGDFPTPGEFVLDENELENYKLLQVKSLTLSWCEMSTYFLDDLFTLLPNVYSLKIHLYNNKLKHISADDVFRPISYNMPKLRLKKFSLQMPDRLYKNSPLLIVPWSFWSDLGAQKLRILKIQLFIDEDQAVTLKSLLESLSNTLEVFSITSYLEINSGIHLPPMKKLERLELPLWMNWRNTLQIVLPRPSQLPKLTSLSLTSESIMPIFGDSHGWIQVKELELEDVKNNPRTLSRVLGHIFPNLRRLVHRGYEYAHPEIVNSLAWGCPHLEDLEMSLVEKNLSITLTGLPASVVHMLSAILGQAYQDDLFSRIDTTESFLVRLTELRRLKLHILPIHKENPCVIDAIAVHLALLRMKPLLELTLIGDFTIAEDLVVKLTAHHLNVFQRKTPSSPKKTLRFRNFR